MSKGIKELKKQVSKGSNNIVGNRYADRLKNRLKIVTI